MKTTKQIGIGLILLLMIGTALACITTTTTTTQPCDMTTDDCYGEALTKCGDRPVLNWHFDEEKCKCYHNCGDKPTTTTEPTTTTTTEATTTTTKSTTTTTEPETTTTTNPETTTTTQTPTPTTLAKTDRVIRQSTCTCGGAAPAINATPLIYWCHSEDCNCLPNYKPCPNQDTLPKGTLIKHFLDTCNCAQPNDHITGSGAPTYTQEDIYRQQHDYFAYLQNCQQADHITQAYHKNGNTYPIRYLKYYFPLLEIWMCTSDTENPQGEFYGVIGCPQNLIENIIGLS